MLKKLKCEGLEIKSFKYIYGKRDIFLPIIKSESEIQLRHIDYYAKLENDLMRDDESIKEFKYPDGSVSLVGDNGIEIPVINARDIKKTPECYCICFSDKKNSLELFERFEADICVEVDVSLFEERLKCFLKGSATMLFSRGGIYYERLPPVEWSIETAPFYKNESFDVESEYRIVIIPTNDFFYERMLDSSVRGKGLDADLEYIYFPSDIFYDSFNSFSLLNKQFNHQIVEFPKSQSQSTERVKGEA